MDGTGERDMLNRQKFNKWADDFEERGKAFQYFQKRVISLIDLSKPTSFLDLGCGTGWAVRYVSALMNGKGTCVGVDISEKMIDKAKEISRAMPTILFYNASSENLPLENDSFDNIICTFSFHHYSNPMKALAEAHRVLKPRGRIFILDGTPDDIFMQLIEKMFLSLDKAHVKQYSTKEFKQMFPQARLKYVKSKITFMYPIKVHIAEKQPSR